MFKIIFLMLDYRIIVNIRSVMYMYKVIDTIRFLCMNWRVIVVTAITANCGEWQRITTTLRGFSAKIILLSRDVGVTSHVKSRWFSTQKAKCPPWLRKLGKITGRVVYMVANSTVQTFSISELNIWLFLHFWHMFFFTFIVIYIEIYL